MGFPASRRSLTPQPEGYDRAYALDPYLIITDADVRVKAFRDFQSGNTMTRVRMPCPRLTFEDAVIIQMRIMDGEFHSRIASDFDVNQGRISEVRNHKLHPGSYEEALKRKPH